MVKSVIKELIVILLILLAIILVLGIFLYDYMPTNKIVPKIEQYQIPNSIQKELNESINDIEEESTEIVYEIDGTDLKNYEKEKDYQKGKANPFGKSDEQSNSNNNDTNNNDTKNDNTNNNINNNTNNTISNSNSVGNYLPNTGIK